LSDSKLELKVDGVTKLFGSVTALYEVSFEAERGEFVTVLGPSGSGKTSLLRCIAGVETPNAGTIEIGGKVVFSKRDGIEIPPEQRSVGMVYQSYALWPHMTVFDNVAYPLRVRGVKAQITERVEKVLGMLNMAPMKQRYPYQLSGGEQQRVAFARALVYDPRILLLDEPFSNLDTPLRERLRDQLKMIQQETGVTTVYVTHHRIEASSISDEIVVFSGGRISAQGSPASLLEHPPNAFVASFLGGLLVLDGVVRRTLDGAILETRVGKLKLTDDSRAADGQAVEVYVRPSLTRLVPENGRVNRLQGAVVGVTREVDLLEYHVAVAEQMIRVPHALSSGWMPAIKESVFLETLPSAWILAEKRSSNSVES